jgi:hypothetical protein
MPTHYGNCAAYNSPSVPSNYSDFTYPFAPPAPPGYLECLQYWDIMGGHWRWAQPGGFSRYSRGWIDPKTTISYQLPTASAFNALHLIAPIEAPPGQNGVPNLIRLSHGQLSDPFFYGYFVECRVKANGDEGLYPNSMGIPAEGLVITNVHESSIYSKTQPAPAAHIVRPNFPAGTMDSAFLSPADTFTDSWNMTIRFNGFTGGTGIDRLCDVEIAYGKPLLHGPIVMWQNRVTLGPVEGTGLSTDIGVNQMALATAAGPNAALGMAPLWPNHLNTLSARVHTLGTLPVENVRLSVRVKQPVVIDSRCGEPSAEPLGEIPMPPVDPLAGATGAMSFVAHRGSLSVEIAQAADPATGFAANHLATANVAHLFFSDLAGPAGDPADPVSPSAPAGGVRGGTTRFKLRANPGCGEETSFSLVTSEVPAGWTATVSPRAVSLGPGETQNVTVRLKPPAGARAGASADVTVNVLEAEETPAGPVDPELTLDPRLAFHNKLVGSLEVLGQVVADPASVVIRCSGGALAPLRVTGRIEPAPAPGQALLEYRSRRGGAVERFVTTDAAGAFVDSFAPAEREPWQIQAFWPGDATHGPVQSRVCVARN